VITWLALVLIVLAAIALLLWMWHRRRRDDDDRRRSTDPVPAVPAQRAAVERLRNKAPR
jgi:nitric oxide reductase large subunit